MLRSPPKDEAIGKIFGRNPALHPFLEQRLPDVSINIFSHISKANVLVNCRFAKRHPIYVCTSMVEENLLAGWEKDKLNIAIISVLICVLIITLLFVLSRQVTAREIAVINAEKAKEEADAASAAKSEFLAAMSHDLRTPLNAIMGFAEMMELRTFGKLGDIHYERYAKDIHESGKLLVSLINDVLDLSKVEAGKYELHEENIDINNHISSTIKMISPQANNKRIKLITVNNTENMILRADERVMTQVLNNLLSNAIKFTPRGGDVTVTSATDTSSKFSITIGDTGIGMSQENIDRAMQPFEQANNNHAQNHEGTGLGLHLCKHFMKLHGGTLEIKSEINVGTQVTINFPTERTVRSK
ncbi:MAG: hypothetical protein HON65_06500 [Rhodospirillales bacterium]|nr:hypothetical protein [Rhodospirillales bacterium]